MTQALPKTKLVTYEEFVKWKPDGKRYELHNGVIIEVTQPLGDHEEIVGFLVSELNAEYRRLKLPYFIPKTALVKPPEGESGYSTDVLTVNKANLTNEPLWKKESTVTLGESIPLVVEVVSTAVATLREAALRASTIRETRPTRCLTNWRDDYYKKLADYEEIGIPEYWIVDYAALGGKKFTGDPKQPTISVSSLVKGEYQVSLFRGDDRILSPTFPELNLTALQIFNAAIFPV